jgi:hypothetical protein
MCDTKFFRAALEESFQGVPLNRELSVADMSLSELSALLKRAQELTDAAAAARAEEGTGEPVEESARRTR